MGMLLSPPSPQTTRQPSAEDAQTIFSARGLRKVYHTGDLNVVALQGVDLDFHAGELVVLLGASGSGKSTLLNILGGLDIPTAGTLRYKGWDLSGGGERTLTQFRRNCVGFVFQFYNLIPSLTARENVALITDIAPDPMKPEDALDRVGLSHRLDHFPSQVIPSDVILISITAVLISFAATLYPSWAASRLSPAEALRYE